MQVDLDGCCLKIPTIHFLMARLLTYNLTLVLLNLDMPAFANSVDQDQLASEEAK